MNFLVKDRFFDSTNCKTYYEGDAYHVDASVAQRLAGHLFRHAVPQDAEARAAMLKYAKENKLAVDDTPEEDVPEDGLQDLTKAQLTDTAGALGIAVGANDNKAKIIEMIRAAKKD
jgi:hypothetical protein